ncbi:hypothetical protein LXA43DRAFT_1064101 [Ganoderma leucocontextum]|nr:hypothetical protein LXA43DRAFT_1064101 [Ganoderma leucocontextum]
MSSPLREQHLIRGGQTGVRGCWTRRSGTTYHAEYLPVRESAASRDKPLGPDSDAHNFVGSTGGTRLLSDQNLAEPSLHTHDRAAWREEKRAAPVWQRKPTSGSLSAVVHFGPRSSTSVHSQRRFTYLAPFNSTNLMYEASQVGVLTPLADYRSMAKRHSATTGSSRNGLTLPPILPWLPSCFTMVHASAVCIATPSSHAKAERPNQNEQPQMTQTVVKNCLTLKVGNQHAAAAILAGYRKDHVGRAEGLRRDTSPRPYRRPGSGFRFQAHATERRDPSPAAASFRAEKATVFVVKHLDVDNIATEMRSSLQLSGAISTPRSGHWRTRTVVLQTNEIRASSPGRQDTSSQQAEGRSPPDAVAVATLPARNQWSGENQPPRVASPVEMSKHAMGTAEKNAARERRAERVQAYHAPITILYGMKHRAIRGHRAACVIADYSLEPRVRDFMRLASNPFLHMNERGDTTTSAIRYHQ